MGLLVLLFAGQPPAKAAIVIGAPLLLTRRVRSERVYAEIDWSLLLMFTGLFIIVAGGERPDHHHPVDAGPRGVRLQPFATGEAVTMEQRDQNGRQHDPDERDRPEDGGEVAVADVGEAANDHVLRVPRDRCSRTDVRSHHDRE